MNLPMDPMDQELNGGMGKALPDSDKRIIGRWPAADRGALRCLS
jgi:hypothetical protein